MLRVTQATISLRKSITDDTVPPAGTVHFRFVVESFSRDESATGINFTDDLDAMLTGLTAIGLALSNPCGPGSSITGSSILTLSGSNLPPGGSCTFNVDLAVPSSPLAME